MQLNYKTASLYFLNREAGSGLKYRVKDVGRHIYAARLLLHSLCNTNLAAVYGF